MSHILYTLEKVFENSFCIVHVRVERMYRLAITDKNSHKFANSAREIPRW